MNKTILLKGRTISYTLERKQVKNINLRIRSDCSVYVSANRHVPQAVIEGFLREKAAFILSALDKYAKTAAVPRSYVTGERFLFLGRELTLLVSRGKTQVRAEGPYLYLCTPDPGDTQGKEKRVTQWIDRQCREIFTEILRETYPIFQPHGIAMPKLVLRTMKSRWGSCSPGRGIITLNKRLIERPRAVIEYVVLHEFVHFLHPNHAKPFYETLTALMPDWKMRKKHL